MFSDRPASVSPANPGHPEANKRVVDQFREVQRDVGATYARRRSIHPDHEPKHCPACPEHASAICIGRYFLTANS